jgi:hypothetical protein
MNQHFATERTKTRKGWLKTILWSPEFVCAAIGSCALSAPIVAIFLIGEGGWELLLYLGLYGGFGAIVGLPLGHAIRACSHVFNGSDEEVEERAQREDIR